MQKSSQTKGMILLESKSAIVHEQVKQRLINGRRDRDETTLKFSEFDDVDYHIYIPPNKSSEINITLKMRELDTLLASGSKQILEGLFPGMVSAGSNEVTIKFDCEKIAEADKEDFVEKVSNLKLHCESGPMVAAFTALGQGGKAGPVITLNYRKSESLYICPRDGKVVVIMMLDFEDMTEKAMAKTFLSEFVEAQRMIRNAPSVAYGIKPPGELSGVKGIEKLTNVDIAGFISFAVEPRHVAGKHMGKTVALLSGFRNYLSYHIKCSKTYLHMRMRHRMDEWMKVLNRAQPHVEGEKKTFAGKTFRR